MEIISIARRPAIVVSPNDSVITAVNIMDEHRVGAVAVTLEGRIVGIFTERDLLERVVQARLSTLDTKVEAVMTRNPYTIEPTEMTPLEAFRFMTEKHLRHLPVVDAEGKILAMLSVRHLMKVIVGSLHEEVGFLNAFISS